VGTGIPLGVLPLGTLNHFAKDLRIPLDLEQAVQTLAQRHLACVDVGEVNGTIFINNSSIGIYPDIIVERESLRRQGYRKWTAHAVATARVLRRFPGMVVRLKTPGAVRLARTPILFVGNNEYDIDGLSLGARRRLDAGLLFAAVASSPSTRELAKVLILALLGRAGNSGRLHSIAVETLAVEALTRRLRVAVDGEVLTLSTPLHYKVRPRALSVIVPAGV
jgi:diacylglycerol kinase family enzyme